MQTLFQKKTNFLDQPHSSGCLCNYKQFNKFSKQKKQYQNQKRTQQHQTQEVNWKHARCPEDVQNVYWTTNKQLLNQNQIKTVTNSIYEISTHLWFWLHSHTISARQKWRVQSQHQKRKNKVRNTARTYNKEDTRATSPTSNWCLYHQLQTSHLILPQQLYHWLQSSNWLLDEKLVKVNIRKSLIKSLLNDSIRNMIYEYSKLWERNCQLVRLNGSNINCTETRPRGS